MVFPEAFTDAGQRADRKTARAEGARTKLRTRPDEQSPESLGRPEGQIGNPRMTKMPNPNQTSYGQTLLRERLLWSISGTPIENYRPPWLRGLELDFFYIDHGLAFEFQGDQHFMPIYGGIAFGRQKANDALKRQLCRQMGIVLVKVEAWELPKLKLKAKIFAALNSYRKIEDRSERRAWVRSVFHDKHRYREHKNRKFEMKVEAKCYQHVIAEKFGGVTGIPKKHVRLRAKAMEKFRAIPKQLNSSVTESS